MPKLDKIKANLLLQLMDAPQEDIPSIVAHAILHWAEGGLSPTDLLGQVVKIMENLDEEMATELQMALEDYK